MDRAFTDAVDDAIHHHNPCVGGDITQS